MFKTDFPRYATEGESITCELPCGMTATARIYRDDCTDRPDQRQDGFWPSLDPNSAGYIGPKSARALQKATALAQDVMQGWRDDSWFYCGIAVTISHTHSGDSYVLTENRYNHALWGIECNYPTSGKKHPNAYLRTVANELLPEAISAAEERVAEVLAQNCQTEEEAFSQ